jgi:hypothetical protein
LILTPEKECKIGQNNPENRRTLSFATTSIKLIPAEAGRSTWGARKNVFIFL